jgi:hypothetical protein
MDRATDGPRMVKDQSTRRALGVTGSLMLLSMYAAGAPDMPKIDLPALPEPKPEGYGVHLSKAERRSKSPSEIQRLRAERRNG